MKNKREVFESPEYRAFTQAKSRCRNPKHKAWHHYGGRGIEFKFEHFATFLAHIGPRPSKRHSLDRIDNNSNYELGNVRWATRSEQAKNQRPECRSRRHFQTVGVEYMGSNRRKPWRARISVNNENVHVGCYTTQEEATHAYWAKRKQVL